MIQDLTPIEVAERLRSPDPPLLIDVREGWEVAQASIPEAVHIAMRDLPARLDELPSERSLVVVCHHGNRSLLVARWLDEQGYADVANLAGGIDEWSRTVDPSIPSY